MISRYFIYIPTWICTKTGVQNCKTMIITLNIYRIWYCCAFVLTLQKTGETEEESGIRRSIHGPCTFLCGPYNPLPDHRHDQNTIHNLYMMLKFQHLNLKEPQILTRNSVLSVWPLFGKLARRSTIWTRDTGTRSVYYCARSVQDNFRNWHRYTDRVAQFRKQNRIWK